MELLIRKGRKFLVSRLTERGGIESTDVEVDPETLVHLGTELIGYGYREFKFALKNFMEKNTNGIDYLLLSSTKEHVDHSQSGMFLRNVTLYNKKSS